MAGPGFSRALAAHRAGRLEEAAAAYRRILARDPGQAPVLALLGAALLQQGRATEAAPLLERALALAPGDAEALGNLATALRLLGRLAAAEAALDALLAQDPRPAALRDRGRLRAEQGRFAEAMADLDQALASLPDDPETLSAAGLALAGLHRPAEAAARFRAALARRPGHPRTLYNLANALADQGLREAALDCLDRAIGAEPGYLAALTNRASLLAEMQRLPEAALAFARALALAPGEPELRFQDGLLRLLRGDWLRGWEGYEARWQSGAQKGLARPEPLWRGEDIAGRTILLHAEQGLGDTIQFCRYAPLVATKVVLAVQPPLVRLIPGAIPLDGPLPPFDLHCPLMSLPRAFRTTEATIPRDVPYLHATPWDLPATGLRVGLAWSGSTTHRNDAERSVPAALLDPLLATGATFFSLQRDVRDADAPWVAEHLPGRHFGAALGDFYDTAGLVAAMDLVISVDTSVAHLAGALGKPLWILLPFCGVDWRWQTGRSDSPWYPTARLFRQAAPGDWAGVIASVAQELRHFGA